MAPRQMLLVAGVAAGTLLSDRSDAQPMTTAAAQPMVMANSRTCDGLRDLMIDTAVHQTVVGYSPSPYSYNGRRRYRRQPTTVNNKRGKKRMKTVAPTAEMYAPMESDAAPAPSAGRAQYDFSGGEYWSSEQPQQTGPSHYTGTNNQEKGVEEADIIKTDGKFIYTVRGSELVIAKTWPVDQTSVAARVTFKTLYPQQIYLKGTDVIVQGQTGEAIAGWPAQAHTRIIVVDAANRENPRIRKIVDVEGATVQSRMVRGDLYLVQSSYLTLPPKLLEAAQKAMGDTPRPDGQTLRPWEAQAKIASSLRTALASQITQADVDNALPRVRNGTTTKQMACSDLYIPANNIQMQMTTLAKLSVSDKTDSDLVGAMVAGAQIYASPSTLYVTAPHYQTSAKGYDYGTQVHQFSLGDDKARPSYVASGRVEGTLLNQFSMSEWKGDLRIATTDQNMTGNNLFVMRPNNKTLSVIGTVRGMGKGERIFSGRLIGEQGYIVTFRQTDPLYTLDLKDPTHPKVAGELKVNGFSSYIHPIGDGMLLTIGQDADAAGRQQGVHLQVFDVKDPSHPARKFHEKLGAGSYSTAQSDHKAFLWDPRTSTFAFPVVENNGKEYFQGLAVYNLDKQTGFTNKGRVDHGVLGDNLVDEQCAAQKKAAPKAKPSQLAYCNPVNKRSYRAQYPIMRSIIIDQFILSLSNIGFEIHALADMNVKAAIAWSYVQKKTALTR